ncbi:MAG TPA: RICIN domain-containing protein [Kofleriaceae bacterium]|jgi:hypothetical protein
MRSRLHRARATACVAALSLSLAACLAEDELEEADGAFVGEESAEIVGQQVTLGPNLIQLIHGSGSFRWFSVGFVLAPDLVVGHRNTTADFHQYLWRSAAGQFTSGDALYDNDSMAYIPNVSMYQIEPLPSGGVGINFDSPAAINGRSAYCYNYHRLSNGTYQAQSVEVTINNATNDQIPVQSANSAFFLEVGDLGAPCVSVANGTLYGLVKSVNTANQTAVLVRAASSNFQYWIEGIQNLIQVRNDFRTEGPFTIDYQPQANNAQKMCLDVPSASPLNRAAIQQFPCHGNDNQRWYLDHRASDPSNPRIVSASSGRCIDVPNASSAPYERLQQSLCHNGNNQKFRETSAGSGLTYLLPKSGLVNNLCLSVVNGPSFTAQPTEQRECWSDPLSRDQKWRFGP